ncbi:MAG: YraN family protein [Bacteroidetes bacterium]|nr:YraN family protein [Bacteroidota bacterium]
MKSHNQQTGQEGEAQALSYLLKKGFVLLHKNWRNSHQEVDLIMSKDDLVIFIEVKTRLSNEFGFPEMAVTPVKQKNLAKAAVAYLEKYAPDKKLRFDIVSVSRLPNNWEIEHFEDAFYPYDL